MIRRLAFSAALATALTAGTALAGDAMPMRQSSSSPGAYSAQTAGNDSVRMIQEALRNEGYDVRVDGIYGPNTNQALDNFQERHGSVAARPRSMSPQQAQMPDTMRTESRLPQPVYLERPDTTVTEDLGWDRAGGIREGASGVPGNLGTGRGETGAGGR